MKLCKQRRMQEDGFEGTEAVPFLIFFPSDWCMCKHDGRSRSCVQHHGFRQIFTNPSSQGTRTTIRERDRIYCFYYTVNNLMTFFSDLVSGDVLFLCTGSTFE